MRKLIITCCILANALAFSYPLHASKKKCNKQYIEALLERSKWKDHQLVDHQMGYSYTVMDLTTNKPLSGSSQKAKELAAAQVQSTKFDETENACTVNFMKKGHQISLKLIHQKLTEKQ